MEQLDLALWAREYSNYLHRLCLVPLIANFSEDAGRLSEEEKGSIITRAGSSREHVQPTSIRHLVSFLTDIENFAGGLIYFGGKQNLAA